MAFGSLQGLPFAQRVLTPEESRDLCDLVRMARFVVRPAVASCPACPRFYAGCRCDGCAAADELDPASWPRLRSTADGR